MKQQELHELILSRQLPSSEKFVLLAIAALGIHEQVGRSTYFVAEISISRLSRLLGLHRVTVHNIVASLTKRRILKKMNNSARYILPSRIAPVPPLPKGDLEWFIGRRHSVKEHLNSILTMKALGKIKG